MRLCKKNIPPYPENRDKTHIEKRSPQDRRSFPFLKFSVQRSINKELKRGAPPRLLSLLQGNHKDIQPDNILLFCIFQQNIKQ